MEKVSDLRKKYGQDRVPIKATRVFVKDMEHFQTGGCDGKAWILIDDKAQTRVTVNTYNGNAGKGFKPQPKPLPDEAELARFLKAYKEVPIASCPVAEQA